jgi:FkbM family methyltransferase
MAVELRANESADTQALRYQVAAAREEVRAEAAAAQQAAVEAAVAATVERMRVDAAYMSGVAHPENACRPWSVASPDVGLAAVFTCLDKDITISDAIRAGVWWEAWMHRYLRDDLCASVARSPPRPGPSRADSGEVVLDIGANIGTHTVALAKMGWRVIAFEPQRQVYELLHANILVNGCTRVNAFHMGLSNEGGSLRMARYSLAQGANMGGVPLGKEHTGELVTVQKLDDVLAALGGPRVRLIKIDVEGHERQVFEGGAATLRRDRPIIYFEDHTGENQRWLRAFGYSIERFAEGSNDFRAVLLPGEQRREAAGGKAAPS